MFQKGIKFCIERIIGKGWPTVVGYENDFKELLGHEPNWEKGKGLNSKQKWMENGCQKSGLL